MSDNQVVERVKVLLSRTSIDSATALYPVVAPLAEAATPATADTQPGEQSSASEPGAPKSASEPASGPPQSAAPVLLPDEALQVLTLAQRTAEEHIAASDRHARQLQAEAESAADRVRREAEKYAENVRAEADGVLTAAHSAAELTSRDAYAQAAEIRRQAEQELTNARAEAERIVAGGSKNAEQLKQQAEQRYEDAVGGLSVRREGLQKQIESLEVFDADFRRRLTTFLQNQLRALWADQPQATDAPPGEAQPARSTEPA